MINCTRLIEDEYYWCITWESWEPLQFVGWNGFYKCYEFARCGSDQPEFDRYIIGIIYKPIREIIDNDYIETK